MNGCVNHFQAGPLCSNQELGVHHFDETLQGWYCEVECAAKGTQRRLFGPDIEAHYLDVCRSSSAMGKIILRRMHLIAKPAASLSGISRPTEYQITFRIAAGHYSCLSCA